MGATMRGYTKAAIIVREPVLSECRTDSFVEEFSYCLLQNSQCKYAVDSISSYLCLHPDHKSFHRQQ